MFACTILFIFHEHMQQNCYELDIYSMENVFQTARQKVSQGHITMQISPNELNTTAILLYHKYNIGIYLFVYFFHSKYFVKFRPKT